MDDSTTPHDEGARSGPRSSQSGSEVGHQFFDWMRSTGLHRPETGWIGGVMALAAEKLRWDAALVRGLGVVALVLFFSPTILLYGLVWLLVPDHDGRIPVQRALRGDFTAGLFGGASLTVVGALNVATPLSLAGPFAILVNLTVIAVVAWIVVAMVRDHRRKKAGSAPRRGAPGERAEGAAGKARAGRPSSIRDDGRPAWYPDETVTASPSEPSRSSTHSTSSTHESRQTPVKSTRERDADRRRRMVTFGLLLVAASGAFLLVSFSGQLGLATSAAVLLGLAMAVVVLALTHMVSALRGRRGRGILLTAATASMLVSFALWQAPGSAPSASGTTIAFGNYTTTQESVNTAFSNTTVDLRHLEAAEEPVRAELTSAFSHSTVVIPDDAALIVQARQALGNLEIQTQDMTRTTGGVDMTDHRIGDEDADLEILLSVHGAFNQVEIYDATTYAEEVEDSPASSDDETTGPDSDDGAQT